MDKMVTNVSKQEKKGSADMFKERLKKARLNSSLKSKDALAKAVGVNRATITNYETGERKPDIDRFIDLAYTLNVSYDYLLGYSETPIRKYHDTKEMTGLPDNAIKGLNNFVKETKEKTGLKEVAIDILKTIGYLIEKEEEYHIFRTISNFLFHTYETTDLLGQEFVEITDTTGTTRLIPVSDLYNVDILEIQRQLNRLKEDKDTENKTTNNKKKK